MTFTDDEAYSDRRQREFEQREADKAARDLREQEEKERRERTPLGVGNGRVFRGLVR